MKSSKFKYIDKIPRNQVLIIFSLTVQMNTILFKFEHMNTENYQSILTKLKHNPKISQRQLSKDLGYSLGKLNYILRNLEKKKLIKNNYTKNRKKNNTNKYVITSKGRKLEESAIDYSYLALNQQNEDEKLIRKKPFLVAEIGINHNGSVLDAKKLIKLAKKHDFDAVKFQKRDLNVCIPENQKKIMRETPWGYISYLDYKKKIELSVKNYVELNVFAKKIGIDLFVSCWDINSLNLMKKLNFKYNKVASAMITNTEFLKEVAKEKKKTFISTGMCTMSDIEKAVSIFKKFNCNFVLMHSISLYPCDESLLNLNLLKTLKNKFKCGVIVNGALLVHQLQHFSWAQIILKDTLLWIELAGVQIKQHPWKNQVWIVCQHF